MSVAQLIGHLCYQFSSCSGHMPRLQVQSLDGEVQKKKNKNNNKIK